MMKLTTEFIVVGTSRLTVAHLIRIYISEWAEGSHFQAN